MQKIDYLNAKNLLERSNLLVSEYGELKLLHGLAQSNVDHIQDQDIFIAIKGTRFDGHDFISQAVSKGSRAIVLENETKIPSHFREGIVYWKVTSSRAAWTVLCSLSFKNPEKNLHLYAVTGTNGKTSTVWMASQLVRKHSSHCLSIGTLGIYDGTTHWVTDHTTPDPPVFFEALAHAEEQGIPNTLMEVSSHSLIQRKLETLEFNAAVFTSFSRDHLDFHQNMDEYFSAKMLLFTEHLKKDARLIINEKLINKFPFHNFTGFDLWTYGSSTPATNTQHVSLLETRVGERGQFIRLKIRNQILEGEIPYLGLHNAENFIAALLLAEDILKFIPTPPMWLSLDPIPGRCELIKFECPAPKVFVDFAHTAKGLETILKTLRPFTQKKLCLVFGCGGDRDKGKRPEMGRVSETLADSVIITSDNPRNEDPDEIIQDIVYGIKDSARIKIIPDREEAIEYAIKNSGVDDVILIAGKGHEAYQILGNKKIPFKDQKFALNFLKQHWEN